MCEPCDHCPGADMTGMAIVPVRLWRDLHVSVMAPVVICNECGLASVAADFDAFGAACRKISAIGPKA